MARMKKAAAALAVSGLVAGGVIAGAAPAGAATSIVCNLNADAYQYAFVSSNGGYDYQFTLHKGRGFRVYGYTYGGGQYWAGGYGAEHPGVTGYVLLAHLTC
jgi:hypothetical protein